jgi:outer membrane murein-binding lipoprotein Lpp
VRRLSPVLAAVVVALLISGCGDDTKEANDYVAAVNQAQNDFAATFDRLSSQITSTSTPQQDQKTLDGFKTAVDKVVVDLRSVEVPSEVKDLHGRLIREISAYGTEIDKAKAAFADGDAQTIVRAQGQLASAVTRVSTQINRTIDAINKQLRE